MVLQTAAAPQEGSDRNTQAPPRLQLATLFVAAQLLRSAKVANGGGGGEVLQDTYASLLRQALLQQQVCGSSGFDTSFLVFGSHMSRCCGMQSCCVCA